MVTPLAERPTVPFLEALRESLIVFDGAMGSLLYERGVFGVPSLFVGDRLFWGNDRYELVRHFIEKGA